MKNSNKKRKNCRFTNNERFLIRKYIGIHRPIAAVENFNKSQRYLKFGESTARGVRERYHDKCKSPDGSLVIQKKLRPLLMRGTIDQKIQIFQMILRTKKQTYEKHPPWKFFLGE